jgi:hypothetical protein
MATDDQPVITQQAVVTKESDTKTVMGFSGLSLPTPDGVKAIFKMITFFTILTGIVVNGISDIPQPIKTHVLEYMAVVVLILQKAEDFWGIRVDK